MDIPTASLDIQISEVLSSQAGSVQSQQIPEQAQFELWVESALKAQKLKSIDKAELSIRIVDEIESAEYNQQYRQKTSSTNVLSFPAEIPDYVESPLLGDLLICAPVLVREAKEQNKVLQAHWAHIVIHGTLHLLGYDHIEDEEAQSMENLEIEILHKLNYTNPYSH